MIQTFMDIVNKRDWESRIGSMLDNIESRLVKRLPKGADLELTKFQQDVISDPSFWRDWDSDDISHLMIQGATSAGKTLVSELAILDTLNRGQKAIVLVPLKAMVRERTAHFKEDMGHGLSEFDINVFGSSSDYMENDERILNGEHDVAVIVYEKFFAMLSQGNVKVMNNCGLLVVDELTILSSEHRGPKLEMALEIVRGKFPQTRIMCLATCDCKTDKICKWLNIEKPILSTARPVALEEHIVELNGSGQYRLIPAESDDVPPEKIEEKIVIPGYRPDWIRDDKECRLLLEVVSRIYQRFDDAKVLVFVASKRKAAQIADYLNDTIATWYPQPQNLAIELDDEFQELLNACDHDDEQKKLVDTLLPNGIAYHHAGVSTTLRELIEEQFSKQDSNLRIIVATETLTVGVNMPFDAMIMLNNKVYRGIGTETPLNKQEYRNYIGRAGRLGQSNRNGITYLFVEGRAERDRYWRSFSEHDEVVSALKNANEEVLAPYYLSLLHNLRDNAINVSTNYTLDDINSLYENSLLKQFRQNDIKNEDIQWCLSKAHLSAETDHANMLMQKSNDEKVYTIVDFGTRMAPFAFTAYTCLQIYNDFFAGYKGDGLPAGLTREDIDSDRFTLDILYHVCRYPEIANSSTLTYPTQNTITLNRIKTTIIRNLISIFDETDEKGEKKYQLWCDRNSESQKENNELYQLMNKANLGDEGKKLLAAMRAIILFYWTQGLTVSQIRNKTAFKGFISLNAGDIERLAEMASFQLDAVYRCLGTATQEGSGDPVCANDTLMGFYSLHTRVKYGMPRSLVLLANKHIHGLDRNRLLNLKKEAEKNSFTPYQYLYLTRPDRFPKNTLTLSQLSQLKYALERRKDAGDIYVHMQIIQNDLGDNVSYEVHNKINDLLSWGDFENNTDTNEAALSLYETIRDITRNEALRDVNVFSDGHPGLIVWIAGNRRINIGVSCSAERDDRIRRFFTQESNAAANIIIVPSFLTVEEKRRVKNEYQANAVLDNYYLAHLLANAIGTPIDNGAAFTEMLSDLSGIYTHNDFSHFPIERYFHVEPIDDPKFLVVLGSTLKKRFGDIIYGESPELVLQTSFRDFEILPWGVDLASHENLLKLATLPIVVLLSRYDIVHSRNLTKMLYFMRQQKFNNCLLLLESEEAKNEWAQKTLFDETDNQTWYVQNNRISKEIAANRGDFIRKITNHINNWNQSDYLIGISYSHYDPDYSGALPGSSLTEEDCKSDIDKLVLLANKLKDEFGEHRILFDQFYPARDLFYRNQGQKRSLEAYKECKYYLVLWNFWTKENQNCKEELRIILEGCQEGKKGCMFLASDRNGPDEPEPPENYFSVPLSDGIDHLFRIIKNELEELES